MNQNLGIGSVLLVVFIVLKLTGNIDWSWGWVLSPLWIPAILALLVLIGIFIGRMFTGRTMRR